MVWQLPERVETAGITARLAAHRLGGASHPVMKAADRWVFVFIATLFVVTALAGFVPSSLAKIAAVRAGERPALPLALHAHAILMGLWLLLLLHRKLGVSSLLLVPAIVAAGIGVVRATWNAPLFDLDPMALAEAKTFNSNLLVMQIRVAILFSALVAWALLVRVTDPNTHKRLMFLATAWLLQAAINRTGLFATISPDLSMLLWIMPMFVYDVVRYRSVPRAYVIWAAVSLPPTIAAHQLWGSSWWLATAPKLLGIGDY
jgi:hypothetical protein